VDQRAYRCVGVVGSLGLPRLSALGEGFVTPYVAVLDITVVFIVLKGDMVIG
jgi:hypothetical protein